MKKLLLLLFICFVQQCICAHAYVPTNTKDSLALVDLYNSTGEFNWTNQNGWLQGPVGTWIGIKRDDQRRVIYVLCNSNSLESAIALTARDLSALMWLRTTILITSS